MMVSVLKNVSTVKFYITTSADSEIMTCTRFVSLIFNILVNVDRGDGAHFCYFIKDIIHCRSAELATLHMVQILECSF